MGRVHVFPTCTQIQRMILPTLACCTVYLIILFFFADEFLIKKIVMHPVGFFINKMVESHPALRSL